MGSKAYEMKAAVMAIQILPHLEFMALILSAAAHSIRQFP